MKKTNWFVRLANRLGGGREGMRLAVGASKHERGKRKPRGWHALRRKRKRQKLARRAQRGKR